MTQIPCITFLKLNLIYVVYVMGVLSSYMPVYRMYASCPLRYLLGTLGLESVTEGCELSCGCWSPNLGPLQGQVLLPGEPALALRFKS